MLFPFRKMLSGCYLYSILMVFAVSLGSKPPNPNEKKSGESAPRKNQSSLDANLRMKKKYDLASRKLLLDSEVTRTSTSYHLSSTRRSYTHAHGGHWSANDWKILGYVVCGIVGLCAIIFLLYKYDDRKSDKWLALNAVARKRGELRNKGQYDLFELASEWTQPPQPIPYRPQPSRPQPPRPQPQYPRYYPGYD